MTEKFPVDLKRRPRPCGCGTRFINFCAHATCRRRRKIAKKWVNESAALYWNLTILVSNVYRFLGHCPSSLLLRLLRSYISVIPSHSNSEHLGKLGRVCTYLTYIIWVVCYIIQPLFRESPQLQTSIMAQSAKESIGPTPASRLRDRHPPSAFCTMCNKVFRGSYIQHLGEINIIIFSVWSNYITHSQRCW